MNLASEMCDSPTISTPTIMANPMIRPRTVLISMVRLSGRNTRRPGLSTACRGCVSRGAQGISGARGMIRLRHIIECHVRPA